MKTLLTGSFMLSPAFCKYIDIQIYIYKQTQNWKPKGQIVPSPITNNQAWSLKTRIFLEVMFLEVIVLFEICLCSAMYSISVVFLTSEWTKILDQSFLWESLILVGWVRLTGV